MEEAATKLKNKEKSSTPDCLLTSDKNISGMKKENEIIGYESDFSDSTIDNNDNENIFDDDYDSDDEKNNNNEDKDDSSYLKDMGL